MTEVTNALNRLLDTDDAGQVTDVEALLLRYPARERVALLARLLDPRCPAQAQQNAGELLAEWAASDPQVTRQLQAATFAATPTIKAYLSFALAAGREVQ